MTLAAPHALAADVRLAARSDLPVLISSRSSIRPLVIARQIHDQGSRSRAPFVTVGYEDALDVLEDGVGGTLLVTDIGDADLDTQHRLVDHLDTRGRERHGSHSRLISSTGRRLVDLVAQGAFRADLFYRLNAIHIVSPTMRVSGAPGRHRPAAEAPAPPHVAAVAAPL